MQCSKMRQVLPIIWAGLVKSLIMWTAIKTTYSVLVGIQNSIPTVYVHNVSISKLVIFTLASLASLVPTPTNRVGHQELSISDNISHPPHHTENMSESSCILLFTRNNPRVSLKLASSLRWRLEIWCKMSASCSFEWESLHKHFSVKTYPFK